jgi:MinD-like ATPase involved in chromosome partitioning or flagellar assembly
MAAAREQAAHDPGVGDFFEPPSGPNSVASHGDWPPAPTQAPASGPQPFGDAFGAAGEPFIGGSSYAGDNGPDAFGPAQHKTPVTGWRKAASVLTFGLVKPSPGAKQLRAEEQLRAITASLLDVYVIAFVNSKGGVGKTTVAVAAGNAIARERGDRVIVVDVDTDLGNLSARFHENGGPEANIEALSALQSAGSYQSVRVFTVQNPDRLEMLSSQNDPRSNYRLNSHDFESAMQILRAHYNVILLDCGTSITSNLFPAIAKQVNCLVVVSSNDAPGLNGAWRTLSWLQAHGFSNLLPRTVIALNATSGDKPAVDMKDVEAKFREQVQEVVNVPYDAHLHEGGFISFERMAKQTRKAVMELAGSIAQYYPTRQPRQRPEELGRY